MPPLLAARLRLWPLWGLGGKESERECENATKLIVLTKILLFFLNKHSSGC